LWGEIQWKRFQTRFRTGSYFMSVSDWDKRYEDPAKVNTRPSATLERALSYWDGKPGTALDLACGAGRHALLLANRGWRVSAVDASANALGLLGRHQHRRIDVRQADLEASGFFIPPDSFDLVCDFYYLQRNLFPAIQDGLRTGGLFVAEIPMIDTRPEVPPMNPAFLLEPGELRIAFQGWELLEDAERIPSDTELGGHRRKVATLIARKPLRQ